MGKVANFDECKNAGDFYFSDECAATADILKPASPYRRLAFLCPCGCGALAGVRVRPDGVNDGHAWGWNLSEEKPTTTPSINIMCGEGSHWHGYLTDGVFKPC